MAEFTNEEAAQLLDCFRCLRVKPHSDTPEDLASWMKEYVTSSGGGEVKVETATVTTPAIAIQQPRISTFTGETPVGKGDTHYDMWRYEVKCLMAEKIHTVDSIFQAVRRSLRGEAGRIAMRLGPLADLQELLHKLDSVYGTVELKESLLAKFYSARQREGEDVSTWSCRLEDILVQAIHEGEVDSKKANEMLRVMFWTGLRQRLKDVSGYKYDSIQDFDTLRIAIRQIEHSLRERSPESSLSVKKHVQSKMAYTENPEMRELKGMIQKLSTEVSSLKEHVYMPSKRETSSPRQYPTQYKRENRSRDYSSTTRETKEPNVAVYEEDEPICYRCGQLGHIRLGCRVRLDHSKQALNFKRPMVKGTP